MNSTVFILGVDAADFKLCRKWDCDNILLSEYGEIETFSYSVDVPATIEVWPTIATGLHPRDHGVVLDPASRGTYSSLRRTLYTAHQYLPEFVRNWTNNLKKSAVGTRMPQTNVPTIFESGMVYNWPGVTSADVWTEGGDEFSDVVDDALNSSDFYNHELARAGAVIGWLGGLTRSKLPIAGVHVHFLDYLGHLHSENPSELNRGYQDLNDLVGWLQDRVDNLVIISDHGMQTSVVSDEYPGVHSDRALISTNLTGELPSSVFEVYDWLNDRIPEYSSSEATSESSIPREHLEDLGYL